MKYIYIYGRHILLPGTVLLTSPRRFLCFIHTILYIFLFMFLCIIIRKCLCFDSSLSVLASCSFFFFFFVFCAYDQFQGYTSIVVHWPIWASKWSRVLFFLNAIQWFVFGLFIVVFIVVLHFFKNIKNFMLSMFCAKINFANVC